MGGVLFGGTSEFRGNVIGSIRTLRAGDFETMVAKIPIEFTGLLIEIKSSGAATPLKNRIFRSCAKRTSIRASGISKFATRLAPAVHFANLSDP